MPSPEHDKILTTPPEESRTAQKLREEQHDADVFEVERLAEDTYAAMHQPTLTEQEAWNILMVHLEKNRTKWKANEIAKYEAANRGRL